MPESLESRVAVAENDIRHIEETLSELKEEVHDVNTYLRNDLMNKLTIIREENKSKEYLNFSRRKLYATWFMGISSIVLSIFTALFIHLL